MSDVDNEIREQMLKAAFETVLTQQRVASQVNCELVSITTELVIKIGQAEKLEAEAWAQIEALMKEVGEYEVLIQGDGCNYKISYSASRKSVKVDADAVPEEFCKIERKPKLREIKEMLNSGASVNWARFEESEPKLSWRAVKF